jgi:hypothetical protein
MLASPKQGIAAAPKGQTKALTGGMACRFVEKDSVYISKD